MEVRTDRRYTDEHEWVLGEEGGRVRVGITDYAQDALGDVVYVELPGTGREVEAGESVAEIESTKSVAEVYAPVGGTIVEVNDRLKTAPETVNSDPYGDGWFIVIAAADPAAVEALLDAAAYEELTG
jgi:glycine cleavage system H protein